MSGDELDPMVARLRELTLARTAEKPLYECSCLNTGWSEVDSSGRGTVRPCRQCGGPHAWCRHRRRRGACRDCESKREQASPLSRNEKF